MKNILLIVFFYCAFLASSSGQSSQNNNNNDLIQSVSALKLDSVYDYDWISNSWTPKMKNYKIRNTNGQIEQELYKKIHPVSGEWSNYMLFTNEYEQNSLPFQITGQYWTAANNWITFQYTHYLAKMKDEFYEKEWNHALQKFTSGTRVLYTYTGNLSLETEISQTLDTNSGAWINSIMYNYIYDANSRKIEEVYKLWVDTSFVNNYKQQDIYDTNNRLTMHIEYTWVDTNSTWLGVTRTSNQYDLPGRRIYTLTEAWDNFELSWDSVQQVTYIYNEDSWLLNETAINFDPNAQIWFPFTLTAYSYFPDGLTRTKNIDTWNPINNEWITTHSAIYDSIHRLIEIFEKFIDYNTYEVTAGNRDLYDYNQNSALIETISQNWDLPSGDWLNKSRHTFLYDALLNLREAVTQTWETSWVNTNLTRYFYSEIIGIDEIAAERICNFANPLKAGSAISCPSMTYGKQYEINLISIQGSVVWKMTFTGGESVNVPSNIANGMYLLQFSTEGKTISSHKVIVAK